MPPVGITPTRHNPSYPSRDKKGYVTNIDATVMPAGEVIAKYHDLWHVERSFRMSKTDLRARPMFHRTRDAIEAHLTIVFTALAVAHCIQERTGLAIANVIKQLRPLRSATIVINGATETFPPEIPAPQRKILASLGITNRGTKPNVLTQLERWHSYLGNISPTKFKTLWSTTVQPPTRITTAQNGGARLLALTFASRARAPDLNRG